MKKLVVLPVLAYLRFFARLQLKKNKDATIIGITGSAGKSSTRAAISLILATRGRVKDSGSANSETGIPLNILGLSPINYSFLDWFRLLILAPFKLLTNWEKYDYYVVEMGIDSPDSPKNMSYLLKIIRPHVAVILNATLAHSASFDYLVKDRDPARRVTKLTRKIAEEKIKLALGIDPTGVTIINSDQKELRGLIKQLNSRIIKFGRLKGASLIIGKPSNTRKGFSFSFSYQGHTHDVVLPDYFELEFAYTFAAAISATSALGVKPSVAVRALAKYRSPAGRMSVFSGINNSTVIDSSYNASPASTYSLLQLLHKLAGKKRKIAVIGDMRELGKESKYAHKNLADQIIKHADEAILFGEDVAKLTLPVLVARHFPVKHFAQMTDLIEYLTASIPKNAHILVKGSQNEIFLERVVEAILADPADSTKLCRRGKYWDRIRSQLE